MDNIEDEKFVVLSVIGPHACETEEEIFRRKIMDIINMGKTFWLIKSYNSKPNLVRQFCRSAGTESRETFIIFIEPSTKGGAKPTKKSSSAREYSEDKITWTELPIGLTPVTGKMDGNTFALVFDLLELFPAKKTIDLWEYADFFKQENPITIRQGGSTLCAIKKDMSRGKNRIKSRFRKIVAVGKLCNPYCVWLR